MIRHAEPAFLTAAQSDCRRFRGIDWGSGFRRTRSCPEPWGPRVGRRRAARTRIPVRIRRVCRFQPVYSVLRWRRCVSQPAETFERRQPALENAPKHADGTCLATRPSPARRRWRTEPLRPTRFGSGPLGQSPRGTKPAYLKGWRVGWRRIHNGIRRTAGVSAAPGGQSGGPRRRVVRLEKSVGNIRLSRKLGRSSRHRQVRE